MDNKEVLLGLMQEYHISCPAAGVQGRPVGVRERCFLVPCLLRDVYADEKLEIPSSNQKALIFQGENKFLPDSVFHRLVVFCCRKWKLFYNKETDKETKYLFGNYAVFIINEEQGDVLVLSKGGYAIKLEIIGSNDGVVDFCGTRRFVQTSLECLIKLYCPNLTWKLCIEHENSTREVTEDEILGKGTTRAPKGEVDLSDYIVWFQDSEGIDFSGLAEEIFNNHEIHVNSSTEDFCKRESAKCSEVYKNTSKPRGRCLIINNKTFLDPKIPERKGTERDAENLQQLFVKLQYDVIVHHNLTQQAMRGILQAESHHPDLSQHDSFVCIILSHGEQGTVFSADGKRITYDEIMRYFNGEKCPALLEKPKMIFIQACQGNIEDTGVSTLTTEIPFNIKLPTFAVSETDAVGSNERHPTMADFVVAQSTTPGYVSWRNKHKGTWFVQAIVYVFSRFAHNEDVLSMLTKVNKFVASFKEQSRGLKQVSFNQNSLLKKIYFFPGR